MSTVAQRALSLLILTIPLEELIVVPGVGSVTRLAGLLAVVCAAVAFVARGRVRPFGVFQVCAVAFALWAALTLFWTVDAEASMTRAWTYLQVATITLLIWQVAPEAPQQRSLLAAYVVGASICAVTLTFYGLSGTDAYQLTGKATFEYEHRYVVGGSDPNDLGVMIAIAVPMAWALALEARRRAVRVLCQLYVPVAIVAVLLTGSRGALLALLVSLTIVPLTFPRMKRGQVIAVVVSLILTVTVAMVVVPEAVLLRLSALVDQVSSRSFSSRGGIWQAGFLAFLSSPMLGQGAGAFNEAVYGVSTGGVYEVAHNAFLSVLVELGLAGLTLFLFMLAVPVVAIRRMHGIQRCMWLITVATWFIGVAALSWDYRKPTWFLFGLLSAQGSAAGIRAPFLPWRQRRDRRNAAPARRAVLDIEPMRG